MTPRDGDQVTDFWDAITWPIGLVLAILGFMWMMGSH